MEFFVFTIVSFIFGGIAGYTLRDQIGKQRERAKQQAADALDNLKKKIGG